MKRWHKHALEWVVSFIMAIPSAMMIWTVLGKTGVVPDNEFDKAFNVPLMWLTCFIPIFISLGLLFEILFYKKKKQTSAKAKNTDDKIEKDGKKALKNIKENEHGNARFSTFAEMLLNTTPVLHSDLKETNIDGFQVDAIMLHKDQIPKIKKALKDFNALTSKKKDEEAWKLSELITAAEYQVPVSTTGAFDVSKFDYTKAEKLYFIQNNGLHQIVLGATGSGKSQSAIFPNMDIISNSKNQGSMFVSDVKGELFKAKGALLQSRGYDVKVINFRDFASSEAWNPLATLVEQWQESNILFWLTEKVFRRDIKHWTLTAEEKLEIFNNSGLDYKSKIDLEERFKKLADRELSFDANNIEQRVNLYYDACVQLKAKLEGEVGEQLDELATIIFSSSDSGGNAKYFEQTAGEIFTGIAMLQLQMLRLYVDIQACHFFNLDKVPKRIYDLYFGAEIKNENQKEFKYTVNGYDCIAIRPEQIHFSGILALGGEGEKVHKELVEWKYNKSSTTYYFDEAYKRLKATIDAKTPGERYSGFLISMKIFNSPIIKAITSTNTIRFKEMEDKPLALFLVIPDEKDAYNFFATLMIKQLYQSLVSIAITNPGEKLKRPTFLLLDEFGNFPKVPGFDSIVTVARSRGIRVMTAIQSYDQLNQKYGRENASVIRANMNTTVYLLTDDIHTAEEISKGMGTKTIEITSNGHTTKQSQPLMRAEDVMKPRPWRGIVLIAKMWPRQSRQIPEYLMKESYKYDELPSVKLGMIRFNNEDWKREAYWDAVRWSVEMAKLEGEWSYKVEEEVKWGSRTQNQVVTKYRSYDDVVSELVIETKLPRHEVVEAFDNADLNVAEAFEQLNNPKDDLDKKIEEFEKAHPEVVVNYATGEVTTPQKPNSGGKREVFSADDDPRFAETEVEEISDEDIAEAIEEAKEKDPTPVSPKKENRISLLESFNNLIPKTSSKDKDAK